MRRLPRRDFIGRTTLGTLSTGLALPRLLSGRTPETPSREKLKAGLVGCGGYGMVDARAALKVGGVEFIALCDVDSDHLEKSASAVEKLQGSRPLTFKDYRELLDVSELDVLFIATPPHWHALPFIAACERGLDIYCEKPIAYDIREGRAMVEAARKHRRIVQIGFQRRQSDAIRQAGEFVRQGKAGRIVQVDVQIHYRAGMRDWKPQDPPASLDWDFWCGPAPRLPYSPNIGHFAWRLEAAYGNGHLVDWGIHLVDAVRKILGEKTPRTVQATGGIYYYKDAITTPDILTAQFDFETCPVTWRHRIWGAAEDNPEVNNGIFFFGEEATVFATDARWMVIPRNSKEPRRVLKTETAGQMGERHVADFLEAVRERRPPVCEPEDGFFSTATVQLGMIAYHAGERIAWDAGREEIVGNPLAAKMLRREYRAPWRHPG